MVRLTEESKHLYGHDSALIQKYMRLRADEVFLDIGCGPGTWSLEAAALGARVHAFDPRPLALELLARQVVLNCFENVLLVPSAVWSKDGVVDFAESSCFWGDPKDLHPVPAVSIDGYLSRNGRPQVRLINIDAEGAELEVLEGAAVTVANCRPDLVVEVHQNVEIGHIHDWVRRHLPGHRIEKVGNHLAAVGAEK